ncbi:hypothetical protein MMC20_005630 [Loxospora ochrophaea]|nr:hypothetical protein [Loxospora ochrophaea]
MALQLHELTSDAEFPALMTCLYDSYSNPYNGFWDIFKGASADECTARFTAWHNSDPTSHWLYVTDTKTGEVIGGTQWNIYKENPFASAPPSLRAYWIEEGTELRAIADQLLSNFLAGRPHRMNRPHLLIMWCGTHSSHRRRGAGRLMMEWGLNKADELGLDAFVEATDAGFPLYKSVGFVTVDDILPDVHNEDPTEEWRRLKEQLRLPMHGFFMWRPKGGRYEKGKTKFPWENKE